MTIVLQSRAAAATAGEHGPQLPSRPGVLGIPYYAIDDDSTGVIPCPSTTSLLSSVKRSTRENRDLSLWCYVKSSKSGSLRMALTSMG